MSDNMVWLCIDTCVFGFLFSCVHVSCCAYIDKQELFEQISGFKDSEGCDDARGRGLVKGHCFGGEPPTSPILNLITSTLGVLTLNLAPNPKVSEGALLRKISTPSNSKPNNLSPVEITPL